MFEIVRAIHEALHTESTLVFVLSISTVFAVLGGSVAWVVDSGYKNSRHEQEQQLAYPVVDFEFIPEGISASMTAEYIPKLMLKITNRGDADVQDVQMRATEYTLENHAAIVGMNSGQAV